VKYHFDLNEQYRIVAELDALPAEVDALKRLQAETPVNETGQAPVNKNTGQAAADPPSSDFGATGRRIIANMSKDLITILKFGVLILAVLPLSCATMVQPPDSSFKPDSNNSIIFGKDEVICDGKPVDYQGRYALVKKSIVHFFSRYVSDETVNQNKFVAGQYAFRVTDEQGGYFVCTVPPGKYYFVELDYIGVIPGSDTMAVRTYMPINGWVRNPYLMTFDVPPGRAVYIGTIRHDFHVLKNNWAGFQANYTISFTNDFDAAREWFLKSNGSLKDDVVVGTTERRPISLDKTESVPAPGALSFAEMNSGATNRVTKNSPFYKYDSTLVNAVTKKWYDLLDTKDFKLNKAGKVVIRFRLHPDGAVSDFQILENGTTASLGLAAELAVKNCSPFDPWPSDMVRMIGEDHREITFTFNYY
jgi:TonB family protein